MVLSFSNAYIGIHVCGVNVTNPGSRPAPKSKEGKAGKGSKGSKKEVTRDAKLEEKLVGDMTTLVASELELAWSALPASVQMAIDRLVSSKVSKRG